ncbi:MAG: hypothetical protein ABL984_02450 [Pyrinomonadaceae bacterium]
MRPTEQAKMHLQTSKDMAFKVQISDSDSGMDFRHPLGVTLGGIAFALDEMATGMRATYMLLEEIKRKLDQPRR